MAPDVLQHTLPNGLTLLAEPMPHVRSATMYVMVPCGAAFDPPDAAGLASALAEMMTRGAGDRDAEQLSLALDNLGVDRGESAGLLNMSFYAGTLARSLPAALDIYADVLLRPRLPEGELEAVQQLLLQDLQGLEDSPQEKVMIELRRRYYPAPLNQDRHGTEAGIRGLTPDAVTAHYRRRFRPNGTILSVAGNVDWPALVAQVERLFGGWEPGDPATVSPKPHTPASEHLPKETQQTQIAAAFPSVPMASPEYFAARGAVGVLSGGMSSRLFTEVREKRGLCYSVSASHEALKDRGAVVCYSGTRAERAQETLDVMMGELRKLRDGVEADEIDRMRAGLKTALIMQQESTSARAGAIARDWFHLGRVRSFDELQRAIDGLTPRAVLDYVDAHPFRDPTVVTLGPAPLSIPA